MFAVAKQLAAGLAIAWLLRRMAPTEDEEAHPYDDLCECADCARTRGYELCDCCAAERARERERREQERRGWNDDGTPR